MKRSVESTEDFKLRIAAMLHEKPEHVIGAQRRPHPMLARKKRVTVRKRRRR